MNTSAGETFLIIFAGIVMTILFHMITKKLFEIMLVMKIIREFQKDHEKIIDTNTKRIIALENKVNS